jgi:hypothetical protein
MNKPECHQYKIRKSNLEIDIENSGLTLEEIDSLKISDFEFRVIYDKDKSKAENWEDVKNFIKRHEWLGTMAGYTTHVFCAYYKNILVGVVTIGCPNSFSKMLGENTRDIERLISRGACISWSPKGLASWLIMKSIRWMADNTKYRLFTCYSDPEAGEVGTIYQACNFYYLGQQSGTKYMYADPERSDYWFSDRHFRTRASYKRYALKLGIDFKKEWLGKGRMVVWDRVPDDIEKRLRDYQKVYQRTCLVKEQPLKGKYAYILGGNKRETKQLKKEFEKLNNTYPYPKR